MTAAWGPGCHGKLPSRGDFVAFGLPHAFLDRWDRWLSDALAAAQRTHGEMWDGLFAVAPVWRFILDRGVCGPDAVAGVMAPSQDRVGRLYPFVVASALSANADPAAFAASGCGWFREAETVAKIAGALPLDRVAELLAGMGRRPALPAGKAVIATKLFGPLPLRFTVWWSRGGRFVAPSLAVAAGLPSGVLPAAFFDGAWRARGWNDDDDAG